MEKAWKAWNSYFIKFLKTNSISQNVQSLSAVLSILDTHSIRQSQQIDIFYLSNSVLSGNVGKVIHVTACSLVSIRMCM